MTLPNHLAEQLKPFLPIRVVLVLQEGVIHGLTELSFAMKTDPKRVNIFWSGKAYSLLGEHDLDGVSWAEENCNSSLGQVVVDPLDPDSPIEVDWTAWLKAFQSPTGSKFHKRNAPFTAKPFGAYVIRALVAEHHLGGLCASASNIDCVVLYNLSSPLPRGVWCYEPWPPENCTACR